MDGKISFEIISAEDRDNSSLEIIMVAQNKLVRTVFTFYIDIDSFTKFGEDLMIFPQSTTDSFIFKIGKDSPDWAFYGLIEGSCTSTGKITLKIFTDTHGEEAERAKALMFIESYPQSIKKLGALIKGMKKIEGSRIEWDSKI